jgi:hypothetical protein
LGFKKKIGLLPFPLVKNQSISFSENFSKEKRNSRNSSRNFATMEMIPISSHIKKGKEKKVLL